MNRDEYNQFVLNQVDHEGSYRHVECPSCQAHAIRNDFEACHTGAVNQHYIIECDKCGFHECDQEWCATCELGIEHEESELENEKQANTSRLDELSEQALKDACTGVNPVVMTEIKRMLQYEIEFDSFCCFLFTKERLNRDNFRGCLIEVILRKRFNHRLEKKIEQAKAESL